MSTIVAPLTPVQRSAVIVLRVSGPEIKNLFTLFNVNPQPRAATLCRYISKKHPSVQDDVLLTYFNAPHSYTGEDVLEISFHGNPLIVHAAIADMLAMGVRTAETGEFTKRAYLNGKMTLAQAEAVNALINAHTETGISVAKNTLDGKLDKVFYEVRKGLTRRLAELEAAIDFSEEMPETAENNPLESIASALAKLNKLLDEYRSAQMALNGVRVVIAGAPNAGKSTLFNALVGRERAIVSDEAGTTRDTLSEMVSTHGVNFALVDTAGVRESESKAEQAGVRRTMNEVDEADLLLILVDLSEKVSPGTTLLMENTKEKSRIIIGTKCDLATLHNYYEKRVEILISVDTDINLDELREEIASKVAGLLPKDDSTPAILAERQRNECAECIRELSAITKDQTPDLQAYHLRRAVQALDRSQGVLVAEQTLDEIFSRFCIGK